MIPEMDPGSSASMLSKISSGIGTVTHAVTIILLLFLASLKLISSMLRNLSVVHEALGLSTHEDRMTQPRLMRWSRSEFFITSLTMYIFHCFIVVLTS